VEKTGLFEGAAFAKASGEKAQWRLSL
jgi:hypothetical protein